MKRNLARQRKRYILACADLFEEWSKDAKAGSCCVCGDYDPGGMTTSIFQKHRLYLRKNKETLRVCGSCHNIVNTTTKDTTLDQVRADLMLRHKRMRTQEIEVPAFRI